MPEGAIVEQSETARPRVLTPESVRNLALNGTDHWNKDGQLSVEGDYLFYRPSTKIPFRPERSYEEQKRTEQRGFELAKQVDPKNVVPESLTIPELKKVPNPLVWAILEANPSLVRKGQTFVGYPDYTAFSPTRRDADPYDMRANKGKVMDVWRKISVDSETLRLIQDKIKVYLEGEVAKGEMPATLLETARGIIKYPHASPHDPEVVKLRSSQKQSGENPDVPRVEFNLGRLYATEEWQTKGQLRREDNYLIYQDQKLKQQNRQRQITIATQDPHDQDQRFFLTKTAWDVLFEVPIPMPGYTDSHYIEASFEKPFQDKKGRYVVEVKSVSVDSETLNQMQQAIANYVSEQVTAGRMDPDLLTTVNGILNYRNSTLEPIRIDGGTRVYRLKIKERPVVREKPVVEERPLTLINKIAQKIKDEPEATIITIEVTGDDIKKYLATKQLPYSSRIEDLKIETGDSIANIKGTINVPIPFVGGKVQFDLALANSPDLASVLVKNWHFDTNSGRLHKRLSAIEGQLKDISGFILGDLNDQLRARDNQHEVSGITITNSGNFSLKVK